MSQIADAASSDPTIERAAPCTAVRRGRLLNVTAAAVLVVGLALSITGAAAWHGHIQSQVKGAFISNASHASETVATSLRRDLDFVATQRGGVTAIPDLTNRMLAAWYASVDITHRYPGGVGFAFVQRVLPSQLQAFGAEVLSDPLINEPLPAPYEVYPPGARPQYCLQRYAIATSAAAEAIPATFDFCSPTIPPGSSPSPIPSLLQEAADTGDQTVLAAGTIAKTPGIADLFVVFSPIYTSAHTPASVAARRTTLRGWIVATYSGNSLLTSDTLSDEGLADTVSYDEPGAGSTTIASSGKAPRGPLFTRSLRLTADGSWVITVVGSARSTAMAQALGVGALGAAVSLLLFLLFMLLTRSRNMALRLVNKRTSQLRHQALYDTLTDLPNRALILDRAQQMLMRAKRQPLSVGALFIDLDHFKQINDTFGHETGDEVLKAVAARLSDALRANDSVGRLGGDEFVVLTEGELGASGPEQVAERLLAVLSQPFTLGGNIDTLNVSVSIGVALGARASAAELLRDADVALYEAKTRGRHGYVIFQPQMHVALQSRVALESDLRQALARNELRIMYQPTFDLQDMTVTGVEALLRWRHPTRGDIPPDKFIPIAEDSGLIIPIGQFVLDQACMQGATWRLAGYPIAVAVNVSGRQLEREDFVGHVRSALQRSGLDPRFLTLEITESVLMRDKDTTATRLHLLKSLGIRIAVDDFGTGYSSLAYLRQFPVDCLKIDRSFITSITEATEAGSFIHTLVELGRALGVETLAEGIEKEAQLTHLQLEHCDTGQGFLFSRPLEVGKVEEFFAHSRTLTRNAR